MGIGMKTRTPSQGTFNQEPKKKREDLPQKRRNHSSRNHSHSFKADHKKEVAQQEVKELLMLVEVPVEVVIQLEMHNGTL